MADITKCEGIGCPHKENCYRYTAEASELCQIWFIESPIKDNKCDMYLGENAKEIWN